MNKKKKGLLKIFSLSLIAIIVIVVAIVLSKTGDKILATNAVPESKKEQLSITVYKSPTCSCCSEWVKHLEKEGFNVTTHDRNDMDNIRKSFGVKTHLASCHTATIGNYVIEGHVPAADIKKLLREKPAEVAGLTAPGMPQHSPGMQPPGEKPRDYNVLSFDKEGGTRIYAKY